MRWLIASVLFITSSSVLADGPLYGELQFGAGGVSHTELDFFPTFGTATLGAFVFPGIGIELFADSGISDDESGGFDLIIDNAFGIAARFQSPPTRGVQGFIVLGAVRYTPEQQSTVPGSPVVSEEFTGVRASIGLMQRLERFPYLQITAEYRHYNADEPLRVDALVFGLRVNAP